ncbi:MAG TPA: HEAT repeat domain-containing protein [Longimicrobiales bacterium]
MNEALLGGASRPRRRRALQAAGLIFIAGVLLVAIRESKALVSVDLWDEPSQQFTRADTVYARQLLSAVAGANGVLCGAVDRSFDTGYSSHSLTSIIETDFADQQSADVSRWLGRRRYHASVLPLARAALSSPDACVRRIGARLAGNTDVTRLHERLQSELNAAQPSTRSAALFALGFADDAAAIPPIRERLQDSDRNVRVAAIWALGSIGDAEANSTLISLLERDGDAVVRSAAAWALGRIND